MPMQPDNDMPQRKYPHSLPRDRYQQPQQAVGFTMCARRGIESLADDGAAHVVIETLATSAEENGCIVVAYCVMPDHLHFLASVESEGGDLISFVDLFRRRSAFALKGMGLSSPVWHKRYWDRHVRSDEHLRDVIEYILANPVRGGLCREPEDWPHSKLNEYRGQVGPA